MTTKGQIHHPGVFEHPVQQAPKLLCRCRRWLSQCRSRDWPSGSKPQVENLGRTARQGRHASQGCAATNRGRKRKGEKNTTSKKSHPGVFGLQVQQAPELLCRCRRWLSQCCSRAWPSGSKPQVENLGRTTRQCRYASLGCAAQDQGRQRKSERSTTSKNSPASQHRQQTKGATIPQEKWPKGQTARCTWLPAVGEWPSTVSSFVFCSSQSQVALSRTLA